jgi:hypothetical protein
MNTLFPGGADASRAGVAVVSTNTRISSRWILLSPVVISRTSIGVNMQFAVSG